MKVTAIETIRVADSPNLVWMQMHMDEGLVGLGETFYRPEAGEAHIIIGALGPRPALRQSG